MHDLDSLVKKIVYDRYVPTLEEMEYIESLDLPTETSADLLSTTTKYMGLLHSAGDEPSSESPEMFNTDKVISWHKIGIPHRKLGPANLKIHRPVHDAYQKRWFSKTTREWYERGVLFGKSCKNIDDSHHCALNYNRELATSSRCFAGESLDLFIYYTVTVGTAIHPSYIILRLGYYFGGCPREVWKPRTWIVQMFWTSKTGGLEPSNPPDPNLSNSLIFSKGTVVGDAIPDEYLTSYPGSLDVLTLVRKWLGVDLSKYSNRDGERIIEDFRNEIVKDDKYMNLYEEQFKDIRSAETVSRKSAERYNAYVPTVRNPIKAFALEDDDPFSPQEGGIESSRQTIITDFDDLLDFIKGESPSITTPVSTSLLPNHQMRAVEKLI
jgi:hypothetical protein